jgi:hypothetical protein
MPDNITYAGWRRPRFSICPHFHETVDGLDYHYPQIDLGSANMTPLMASAVGQIPCTRAGMRLIHHGRSGLRLYGSHRMKFHTF